MNNELKIIKKKYGEKMMHLCRELFSTILENNSGMLVGILLESFEPSHYLYDDLIDNDVVIDFKNYIYAIYDKVRISKGTVVSEVEDPVTLMKRAGYALYECTTEEEIQKFRKYYASKEELCTFNGGRLNRCYVYFAVKDNALELKRSDFKCPQRQDEYGISVISIQFTRDSNHTLSIKNRYNHTVGNPDATYSNNLDNIIPGLTQSFADYYGLVQGNHCSNLLEIPKYVRAGDGKFYKYNYEINNIYYCPGNIIIDNFHVERYPNEKFLIFDYFILDLVNKECTYNNRSYDSFPNSIGVIKNISIKRNDDEKMVIITPENGEDVIIKLDKYNRIIGLINNNIKVIFNNFLVHNTVLKEVSLKNVLAIEDCFLFNNETANEISLPNVLTIGESFMCRSVATKVNLPKVRKIGYRFMSSNHYITILELPNVEIIGGNFLAKNEILEEIWLPCVIKIAANFLENNKNLKKISLPSVLEIDRGFCYRNEIMEEIYLPNVQFIWGNFLYWNNAIKKIEFPQVVNIGINFMISNLTLETVKLPNIKIIGENALLLNKKVCEFYAPLLETNLQNKKIKVLQKKSKPGFFKRIW